MYYYFLLFHLYIAVIDIVIIPISIIIINVSIINVISSIIVGRSERLFVETCPQYCFVVFVLDDSCSIFMSTVTPTFTPDRTLVSHFPIFGYC